MYEGANVLSFSNVSEHIKANVLTFSVGEDTIGTLVGRITCGPNIRSSFESKMGSHGLSISPAK